MTDYTWPSDLVPYAVSFYLQPHTGGSESPFSRQTKTYGLSAPRWVCRMTFRGGYNGTTAQGAFGPRLDAMIAKLKGRQNRVTLHDWRRPAMRSPLWPAVPGNNAAATGATTMTLTGLVAGTTIYAGDYIGGDGRPHIVINDVTAAGTTATVTFEPPLQSAIAANAGEFGKPTGLFRLTSDDAGENETEVGDITTYTLEFVEDPEIPYATLFRGTVFGWNQDAAVDSARFASTCEITPTTGLIAFSQRDAPTNDGEVGMRLVVADYTLNLTTQTVTMSAVRVIEEPPLYTSGLGACWAGQLLKLPTGRILLFYMFLNTPDGTYTHADARMDNCLRYSDDNGVTWSAKQTLASGETAYASFGVADYNSPQAGLNIAGGTNHVVQLPSGRVVLTGYLLNTGTHYLASLYTDSTTGITGWTFGTPLVFNSGNDNEPSVAVTSTGSLVSFVRNETVNSRSVYTSTNGATWAFNRSDTNLAIRNVANSALGIGTTMLVGGSTLAGDNRKNYEMFRSTNDGAAFSATPLPNLFHPIQRIGYSHLNRLSSGHMLLAFEETSVQSPTSFNQKGSVGLTVFDDRYLNGVALKTTPHDSTLYNAATEAAAYTAYVTGDGGTVQDSAAVTAAITAAIAGNYYSSIGFAVSARWGHKSLGAANQKLYSLNRIKNTSSENTAEWVALDTTSFAYAVAKFSGAAGVAWLQFDAMNLRKGARMGAVIAERTAGMNSTNGFSVRWTDVTINNFTPASASINAVEVVKHAPGFATDNTKVAGYFIDFDELLGIAFQDGVATHAARYFTHTVAQNETANVRLQGGAANALMAETWFFNSANLTVEAVEACGVDLGARY